MRWFFVAAASMLAACSIVIGTDGLTDGGPPSPDASSIDAQAAVDASDAGGLTDSPVEVDADAASAVHPYMLAVASDMPRAYLRFEEDGGTIARDEKGTTPGQYMGAYGLGAEGAFDGSAAVTFDGGLGGVTLGDVFDFEGRAAFTIEAWFKARSYANDYRFILANEGTTDAGRQAYGIWVHSIDGAQFERYVDGTKKGPMLNLPTLGQFHHFVASYDGTTMRLYIDGMLAGVDTDPRAANVKSYGLWIGRQQSSAPAVDGVIDEVAIYDKELPAARVTAHFAASGR